MIFKKSISWLLIGVLLFSAISTGQDMLARAESKTDVETVEERMFDIIKEENESPNKITGNFLQPKNEDGIYYAAKGYLGWTFNYGPTSGSVKVSVESTTHPEIINPNTMRVKLPQERTEVTISGKLEPINDGTGQLKSFNMTVAVMPRASVKLPIDKVGDALFEAIRGENSSADNITKYLNRLKNKNKTTAFINPYNGQISFEEDKNGIDIEFISSDDESVLNHETLKINFPQTEKKVKLTARLTHKHGGYDEEKTVVLPLVIKGRDVNPIGEEVTFTNEVKRKLFDAIKGKNESPDNIENDLQLPKNSLPIYAVGSIDNINWTSGGSYYYKAKVDFESCDRPDIVDISNLSITRPAEDTVVTLKGKITPKNHTHGDMETFSLPLNIKAKKKPKNYLEEIDEAKLFQAVKAENTDKDNIRYDLRRPVEAEPFYAKLTESGLEWQAEEAGAHLKVETKQSTNPELLEPATFKIKRGEADQTVGLKFEVTDLTRNEGEGEATKKEVNLELKIKAKPKQLPPDLKAGIAEEKRLFDAVRADFFRGIDVYEKNIDENNIVKSMDIQFKEAYFDEENRLYFEPSAHNVKRKGVKLSDKELEDRSFFIEYPDGGNGLFHPYNLVLQNRPATDTRVRIGHYVESFKYQKSMNEYPEDEELQQLKKQIFWTEVIVKAINADVEKIGAAGEEINVVKGKTHYSVLTDDEKISTEVAVTPQNRGAQIMIAGSKLDKRFSREINLKNGFAKVGILVSDEDYLENGTRKETELSLSIVSKTYLESQIATLPQAAEASEADRQKAEKLIIQLDSLEAEDAAKIEGRDKLNAYKQENYDTFKEEKDRLDKVELRLFDAIKAENSDKDSVFRNMDGKYYAKVQGEDVDITKEASDSDVRIEWLSSSHPQYINVLPGYDFESQYAQAFHIRRRPQAESGDTKVKFKARLHSIAEPDVKKDVELDFKLLAYNAQLKAVEVDRASSNIDIVPDKSEYEITYKVQDASNPTSIKMRFFSKMPDVKFDFGAELNNLIGKYESGKQVDIPLDSEGRAEINLTVTEGFKSSYFNNWAEKKYVFRIAPEEGRVDLGRIIAHAGEEVEIKAPEGLNSSQIKWVTTDNKLATIELNKLKLKHPGSFEIIGKYANKEYIYKVIARPKAVKAFGGRIKNGYVKLYYGLPEGADGVFIYRGMKRDGKYRFAVYHEEKKASANSTRFFVPKGKTYSFYIKSYSVINGYKYVSRRTKRMYFAGKR